MPTLDRTRLTWLTYGQLGVYGYFLYGFGPSVPLLRDDLGVSSAVGGLHGTALAAGSTIAGLAFARLSRRIGRAAALRLGLAGLTVGILAYCLVPLLPVTLFGALLCGVFGTTVVTGCVAVLSTGHGAAGPAAISEANAGAAAAGLVAPLLIGAGVSLGIGWRPGLLLAAVGTAGAWVLSVREARRRTAAVPATPTGPPAPGAPAAGGSAPDPAGWHGQQADRPGPLPAPYWLAWVVVLLCIAVEFCLTFWSADALREHTGASPAAATAGVTAIVGGMFLGRAAGGWVALRVPPGRLLLGAVGLSLAGFAGFWASTAPVPALAGLVVVGVGISLQYPLGVARAVAASAGRPDRAAGTLSLATGAASGIAPFGLGALADQVGTHRAFLLVPALLAGAAVGVLVDRRPQV